MLVYNALAAIQGYLEARDDGALKVLFELAAIQGYFEARDDGAQKVLFEQWAKAAGYDVACTYDTERLEWLWLNPMTADLWKAWLAHANTVQTP